MEGAGVEGPLPHRGNKKPHPEKNRFCLSETRLTKSGIKSILNEIPQRFVLTEGNAKQGENEEGKMGLIGF